MPRRSHGIFLRPKADGDLDAGSNKIVSHFPGMNFLYSILRRTYPSGGIMMIMEYRDVAYGRQSFACFKSRGLNPIWTARVA